MRVVTSKSNETRTERHERSADSCNVAAHLPKMAADVPDHPAVILTGRRIKGDPNAHPSITFAQLEALSNRYANALVSCGFTRGMRTLMMVPPGFEFLGVTFALFKMGAVPIMIDPGMGVRQMIDCLQSVESQALIGTPPAHLVRVMRPGKFRTLEHVVTVGRRWCWGGPRLEKIQRGAGEDFAIVDTSPEDEAAILFTSGATGPAKGVLYEHGMFDAQVRALRRTYGIESGEVDLPGFPLFSVFNPALGMTSVVPDMDASRPGRVDPAKIVRAIKRYDVTSTFGSPAMWKRIGRYCIEKDLRLPSLRRIITAGAPVHWRLVEQLRKVLSPDAEVYTPYGATESLPICSIGGTELLTDRAEATRQERGICVGRPLSGMTARVIRMTDDPIQEWSTDLEVAQGTIGEIAVSGPVVTKRYFGLPRATRQAKIHDTDRLWHRMGDVGWMDDRQRIWYCGRKAHRVQSVAGTLFTIPCEAVFNEHPAVARSALVGIGKVGHQTPVIIIEPIQWSDTRRKKGDTLKKELLAEAGRHDVTNRITALLFHRSLPVDTRHNAKINREQLSSWAAGRCV